MAYPTQGTESLLPQYAGAIEGGFDDQLNQLRIDLAETFEALGEAAALAEIPMRRVISASLYMSSSSLDDVMTVWSALSNIFDVIGCSVYARAKPEAGSWYERWWGRTKEVATSDAVAERVAKLERALELKGIENPQADADLKAAKAVRELLKGLESSKEAIAVVGSTCVLKRNNFVFTFTLSQDQLAEVRRNPDFLKNPEIFEKLFKPSSDIDSPSPRAPRRIARRSRDKSN
jgi:hypothetical protein